MSKLRLVFVKEHQASYISHLDVMRTFQRVFPRAGLSIKHSNGFHPHPILSIVLPLPWGSRATARSSTLKAWRTAWARAWPRR